jgi:hypothetical protein
VPEAFVVGVPTTRGIRTVGYNDESNKKILYV